MSLRSSVLALAACALAAAGCALQGRSVEMARIDARDLAAEQAGMASFTFADFGGLSGATLQTNALPWKVVTTALLMAEEARGGAPRTLADLPAILQRFGFIVPDTLANWRGLDAPRFDRPMGLAHGTLSAFPL